MLELRVDVSESRGAGWESRGASHVVLGHGTLSTACAPCVLRPPTHSLLTRRGVNPPLSPKASRLTPKAPALHPPPSNLNPQPFQR